MGDWTGFIKRFFFLETLKRNGAGIPEIEMDERPSEVFCIFAADKTEPVEHSIFHFGECL